MYSTYSTRTSPACHRAECALVAPSRDAALDLLIGRRGSRAITLGMLDVKPLSATGLTEKLLVKISGVASTRRGPAFLQSCRLCCATAAGCKIMLDSYWQEDWTPGPGYFVCTVIAVINADAPLAVGVLKKCCKVWMLISVSTKSSSARRCTAPSTEHIDNFILAFLILLIDFFSISVL